MRWTVTYYPVDERDDEDGPGFATVEAGTADGAVERWNAEHFGGDVFVACFAEPQAREGRVA